MGISSALKFAHRRRAQTLFFGVKPNDTSPDSSNVNTTKRHLHYLRSLSSISHYSSTPYLISAHFPLRLLIPCIWFDCFRTFSWLLSLLFDNRFTSFLPLRGWAPGALGFRRTWRLYPSPLRNFFPWVLLYPACGVQMLTIICCYSLHPSTSKYALLHLRQFPEQFYWPNITASIDRVQHNRKLSLPQLQTSFWCGAE